MGQNETAPNNEQNKKPIEKEKEKENNKEDKEKEKDKDNHMIEILKKENDILRKQLESLNKNNKYNTLITMLEVLEMQRKKILSIKKGKINIL